MSTLAIKGSAVETHYDLSPAEFAALHPNIRALYRAAYTADVLHVVEQPIGSNEGAYVSYYIQTAGLEPPEPWCAAFGTTMLVESGVPRDHLPAGAASTHAWKQWAEDNDHTLDVPVRGCAGILIESPTSGHFILVSHVIDDNTVATIEGNTNTNGSSEGYGVFRRERKIDTINTWVDLSFLTS